MTPEETIERDFRTATADRVSQVHVELDINAEEIRVFYRCAVYTCDCDHDETFYFVRQDGNVTVSFPISEDYLNCDLGERISHRS